MALVLAGALLTVLFLRRGAEIVAAGFLVFALGQTLVLSVAALDLDASISSFGAGIATWAVGLALVSAPRAFPHLVRLLGSIAAVLFGFTALRIFAGAQILPTTAPLPFYAYPVLVATFVGWIWSLLGPTARRSPPAVAASTRAT
jgi:hypothetical protein